MLSVGTTVLGVTDFRRAIDFWCAALDYVPKRPLGDGDDFMILIPREGTGARIAIDVVGSGPQPEPRVHLDLYAGDTADQAAEVARLIDLGATRVDWPHYPANPDFVVMADPDGNVFCVIDTS